MKKAVLVIIFLFMFPLQVFAASTEAVTTCKASLYRYATSGSAALTTVPQGTPLVLISPTDTHFQVTYENQTGWIKRSNVKVTAVDGSLRSEVNYRSSPEVSKTNVLGQLDKGTSVAITAVVGDFCEVRYGDLLVYISEEFVESQKLHLVPVKNTPPKATVSAGTTTVSTGSATGKQIAYSAMDYLGGRYVWGGNNLATGVDCSGFVRQIYKLHGIILEGASYHLVNYGTTVAVKDLRYGDLVFFTSGGSGIGHIGIYVSNDYFVHAASTKDGIIMSLFSSRKDFVTAKRIIGGD